MIKEIGRVITGNTPSKSNRAFYASDDIGFIKPDMIGEDKITYIKSSREFISEQARSRARIAGNKAVCVTCIGIIGKIGIIDGGEYAFNQQINVIEPNEKVSSEYLAYCLLYNRNRLMHMANAPVVPIINKTQFENFQITIKDGREEQNKIVERLSKTVHALNMCKQQMTHYELLIKARFVELFGDPSINPKGWNEVNISEITSGKVSNGFFAKRSDYIKDGNVSVLGVANVVNRMYSQCKNLPKAYGTKRDIKKFQVQYGDLLFCRSSLVAEGIGKASVVPVNVPKGVLFECHVIRLVLDLEKCVPEYIQMLTTTDYYRKQIWAQSKTATMTTIGQEGILKTNVLLPPVELQKQFLHVVQQTEKLKSITQKSINELQLLFDSLMQKYFG